MQLLLLVSCLPLIHSITQQHTLLTAQTPSNNGATISPNPNSVSISNGNYLVEVNTQDSYDLKISLNDSWGFDPFTNSSITLTLDGATPFPEKDADLLFVFTVNDFQYFSFFLHLDTNNLKSRIYPSVIIDKNTQNVSQWISDTITIRQRWHRISNNDQWEVLNEWREQSLWPLMFVITNDPIQKQSIFTFYHDNTPSLAVKYTFNDVFVADKGIDIYIMGDSKTEQYIVSAVDIVLTKQTTTKTPTNNPIFIPTSNPSLIPSKHPLIQNTESVNTVPTHNPTHIPILLTNKADTNTETVIATTNIPSKAPITTRIPTNKPLFKATERVNTQRASMEMTMTMSSTSSMVLFNSTSYIGVNVYAMNVSRNNGYLVVFGIMVGCAVMAVLFQLFRIIKSKRGHIDLKQSDDDEEEEIEVAMEHNERIDCDKKKNDDTLLHKSSSSKQRDEMSSTTEQYEFAVHGRRAEMMHANNESELTLASKITDIMRKETMDTYRKVTETDPGTYRKETTGTYRKETESVFYERIQRPSAYDYEGKYEETDDNDIEHTAITASHQCFMGSPTINRYWNNHIKGVDLVDHSISSLF